MKNKKNFIIRIITGICLMAVMIPSIIIGGIFYLCVTTFLTTIGTYELMNMFYKKNSCLKAMRFIMPIFSGLTMVSFYFGCNNNVLMLPLLVFGLGVVTSMLFGLLKDGTEASDIMSCITSITYAGLLLSMAFSVEFLKPIGYNETESSSYFGKVFIFLYSNVIFTDVFAYFFGSLLGKHKLCEKISPKKSVEGAIFGLVLGAMVGTVLGLVLGVFPYQDAQNKVLLVILVYLLSLVISATSQLGDLVASKLKRSYEIKDYGFIFPGHGGVMDRFDSLIISGSLLFIIMNIISRF